MSYPLGYEDMADFHTYADMLSSLGLAPILERTEHEVFGTVMPADFSQERFYPYTFSLSLPSYPTSTLPQSTYPTYYRVAHLPTFIEDAFQLPKSCSLTEQHLDLPPLVFSEQSQSSGRLSKTDRPPARFRLTTRLRFPEKNTCLTQLIGHGEVFPRFHKSRTDWKRPSDDSERRHRLSGLMESIQLSDSIASHDQEGCSDLTFEVDTQGCLLPISLPAYIRVYWYHQSQDQSGTRTQQVTSCVLAELGIELMDNNTGSTGIFRKRRCSELESEAEPVRWGSIPTEDDEFLYE